MFCTQCGKELDEGTLFCPSCGAKQEVAAPQPEFTQAPQPEPVQPEFVQAPQPEPVQPEFTQAPQPEPVQPEFTQAPQPEQPFAQPYPNYGQPVQQDYGKPKKSPLVPILIGVISAAVIGTGVLLFFLFFRSGNADMAGKYELAAMEISGLTFDVNAIPALKKDLSIELKEDGTGFFNFEGNSEEVTWKLDGDRLDLQDKTGTKLSDYLSAQGGILEYKNGRIYLSMTSGDTEGTSILAKEGDTLSDIEMSTLEDLMNKFSEGIGQ